MEATNVYQKLSEARKLIRETKLKKEGYNSFSKYDYFTPSQISSLVSDACYKNGLLTKYDLVYENEAYIGYLLVYNIENPEDKMQFTMPTAIADIKATNLAQKKGGTSTYNERYLKMSAFEITDNALDFDSQDNRKKTPEKPITKKEIEDLKDKLIEVTSKEDLTELWKSNPKYKLSKEATKLFTEKGIDLQ